MHGGRFAYYITGEGLVPESPGPSTGGKAAGAAAQATVPGLRFGRLFGRTQHVPRPEERDGIVRRLTQLGSRMTEPVEPAPERGDDDSDILAGYTYLGQFIAHEVTFDSTGDLLEADLRPDNIRTPEIDLDSLYGGETGPADYPELYEKDETGECRASLRLGETTSSGQDRYNRDFKNDLPRGMNGVVGLACIGDPRNDENLTLAQTHVAFISFHNRVVKDIEDKHKDYPPQKVFELAREQVIRHYQWIILHDFLPRIVREDVLDCVMRHGLRWFKADAEDGLFMPLEFSAAAFRIGHSMVRPEYEWNPFHRSDKTAGGTGPVQLETLFELTGFRRGRAHPAGAGQPVAPQVGLEGRHALKSDWVIDWRHFYDFSPIADLRKIKRVTDLNRAAKLDTDFGLRLHTVEGFFDEKVDKMLKAITARNLLRGFYLGLPTGEEAAEWMGETPLTRKELVTRRDPATGEERVDTRLEAVLDHRVFWGKTPLWYYVLKEAELVGWNREGRPGNRLGPVGGRIVAETLVGLIQNSRYSIIKDNWRPDPAYARPATDGEQAKFEMIDLLYAAGVVDPIASLLREEAPSLDLNEGQQGAAVVA